MAEPLLMGLLPAEPPLHSACCLPARPADASAALAPPPCRCAGFRHCCNPVVVNARGDIIVKPSYFERSVLSR
jgi:hypothetical protein